MLFKMQPENKLKDKSYDKNHSSFTFSFHLIQLDTAITDSLDATIDIDECTFEACTMCSPYLL